MRWSQSFIPTRKENPREAEIASHKYLVRGGFIEQHASGVYAFLPLARKVILKIENIIREEMNKIGAQEVLLPALTNSDVWKDTGRWESFGNDMFRLKDRWERELALAPTHEEIMTLLAKEHLKSYRDLPQIWYQIQTKFRDEPRPRGGLLRVREFAMKDSYSFDATWEGLDESYQKHKNAYLNIFSRTGLQVSVVKASSGLMGGSDSEEFMVLSKSGEDRIVYCPKCGYSANIEVAEARVGNPFVQSKFTKKEKVHTPGVRTVKEVAEFLGIEPSLIVKSLLYRTQDKRDILVLIRGDYEVSDAKLSKIYGQELQLSSREYILKKFNAEPGFIGPIDAPVDEIIADESIRNLSRFVVGGNRNDYHIVGVNLDDIKINRFADLREVREGDICLKCGGGLSLENAIEVGHIFKLGTKYSASLGAMFTDQNGEKKPIIMGSYGIGVGRIMAANVEVNHDDKGIIWPFSIAPYEVDIIEIDHKKTEDFAFKLYKELKSKGYDVIWDDRDIGAGAKFKDAELVGIPISVVVSPKKIKDGTLEVQVRKTGKQFDVREEELLSQLKNLKKEL